VNEKGHNVTQHHVPPRAAARTPAVIFDLDGTLVDSLDDLTASVNHAMRQLGLGSHTRAAIASMVGDGATKLIARAVGGDDTQLHRRALMIFREHYADHCVDQTRLIPGIAEQLDRLADAGWPMAVLSNKPDAFTQTCAAALLTRWPLVRVAGAMEGAAKKPDPAAALDIASRMERLPHEVFFVGDGVQDVATARAAGMIAVGVLWGYRSREELGARGPDILVENPSELAASLCGYEVMKR
jgi:phosphoglycolate phosphatase